MSASVIPSSTGETVRPEGISIQTAAVLLDVHENTVYNWIRDGIIIAIRIGPRLLRIPRSEIARLRLVGTIRHSTS